MKIKNSAWAKALIPVGCLLALACGGWLFQRPADAGNVEVQVASETTGRFVQEPLQRSSFKPDFTSRRSSSGVLSRKRLSPRVLTTFSEALGNNWKTAVRVMADGEQVALGMIVDPNGWIITKASQLPATSRVLCRLYDYRELSAEVVSRLSDMDLALLRVPAEHLPVASWADNMPSKGHWVATADLKDIPSSVGVVSAGVQRIRPQRSVLGVSLTTSSDGAAISHVLLGTGAYDAGLRIGDNIYEVNGVAVKSHAGFIDVIKSASGGDLVTLKVNRAERDLEVQARLMDLTDELLDDTEMEVNGRVSARATGFDRVFPHDTVLQPNQCGGPLMNLDGEVVGINIARAGRVTSYALPYDVVQPVVESLIAQQKRVSQATVEVSKEDKVIH
ncbi:MAG: PDZ domain-containing protein [bacterium]|nr:PDZ domain-containing protein [bacterium]